MILLTTENASDTPIKITNAHTSFVIVGFHAGKWFNSAAPMGRENIQPHKTLAINPSRDIISPVRPREAPRKAKNANANAAPKSNT